MTHLELQDQYRATRLALAVLDEDAVSYSAVLAEVENDANSLVSCLLGNWLHLLSAVNGQSAAREVLELSLKGITAQMSGGTD